MKGPGIKDYTAELTRRREEAHAQGLKYIEVNSKKLHQEISPDFATMPTCCQAMYKQMLTGDEILERPKGTTGFGSHLTIRFYVDSFEGREKLYPGKKRGRPPKSPQEKEAVKRGLCRDFDKICSPCKNVKAFLDIQAALTTKGQGNRLNAAIIP